MLDQDGVIRVGGRLIHASLKYEKKQQVIIPHSSHVTQLIIRESHEVAHMGTEWVLSRLREKYWIPRARKLIKRISRRCFKCMLYASSLEQKMANLPSERLEYNVAPFTYTGLDCFGPFIVKQGRTELKRYGIVFTCLSIRAVQLEKLNSLETDSFLNGFWRFIARRGVPSKVWSDQGTNFTGGQAELLKAGKQLNKDKIKSFSMEKGIEWCFTPPGASHMGGIWERMIRTICKVLAALFDPYSRLTDEILETLMCEMIINSQPLTKISEDIKDMTAITPNHLLMLREGPTLAPGVFTSGDIYQKRWRYVQHLADRFWKQWLKAYLPELQKRTKTNI